MGKKFVSQGDLEEKRVGFERLSVNAWHDPGRLPAPRAGCAAGTETDEEST